MKERERFYSCRLIRQYLWVFLTAGLFCLGEAESPGADVGWQKIDEGFEVSSPKFEGEPFQTLIKLQILRVNLEKFQIRVLDSRAFGMIRMEIKTLVKRAQALAGVNGGFFLPDYKPLGLLVVDSQEVNALRKADWGIFLIQENRPRIIHTKEFQHEKSISQALQVGPRLVVDGRELQLKKQIARRSAIGITFKNEVVLLNTQDTEAYAQDLAHIFFLPQSTGGLECRDALTLDGGPSAQMYGEYRGWRVDIPGGWAVPNGIGVFKR
jgi:uncharacterized protein YigE (DUF2233 family)